MSAVEVNFDGLVGPTHNYSGLSYGNVASLQNFETESNPREAAKQGLYKMKVLHELGIPQAVLPPQERPDVSTLRRLGFGGSDKMVVEQAYRQAPQILHACSSASSMWTANAATVSPSADTADKRVHFTPANLAAKFHRSIEPATTGRVLKSVFADERYFAHHPPLPSVSAFSDEGAANHTRFCAEYGVPGVEFFVYGRRAFGGGPTPVQFPARHTLEASQAISRLHGLKPARVVYAQQNPDVIDAGVFHNDVIAVGNRNVLFFHEAAFMHSASLKADIREKFGDEPVYFIEVSARAISVEDAVESYLFNSQLVSLPHDGMALILPQECRERDAVWQYLETVRERDNPICRLEVLDLRQSMRNGGGPACLRLRVVLNNEERAALNPGVRFDETLFAKLNLWVDEHYRDRLGPADLGDPQLLAESRTALDELSVILRLGSVYPFQLA